MILPIKKKWFDMIKSGEKREEYREIKPFYKSRFERYCNQVILVEVIFLNGYSKKSPQFTAICIIRKGKGKPEWGAEPDKEYYILTILNDHIIY